MARGSGGKAICSPTIPFYLNNGVELDAGDLAPRVFSPDGDSVDDTIALGFVVDQAASLAITATDAAAAANGKGTVLPVATLTTAAGRVDFAWDGSAGQFAPLPDGQYLLKAVATDGCNHQSEIVEQTATIDTTPPVARIDSPLANARVLGGAVVTGVATDALSFKSYELSLGVEGDPRSLTLLKSSNLPAEGVIGAIPVDASLGAKILKLVVTDMVGHATTVETPITIVPTGLIASFEVKPIVISPNGNGSSKSTLASVALTQGAHLVFELLQPSGGVVGLLGSMTGAGQASNSLSIGQAAIGEVADGDYMVRVTATDSSGVEQATAPLILDSASPRISVAAPQEGVFVSGEVMASGEVEDAHLLTWVLRDVTNASAAVTLASGSAPASGMLARATFLDGPHTFIVGASDSAGNTTELMRQFTVDSTAPVIAFSSPLEGVFLSGQPGPVAIKVKLTEVNPDHVTLESQSLPLPSAKAVVFQGTSVPQSGTFTTWDVASEKDGQYELLLTAVDKAGNAGTSTLDVTVDNTSPIAQLDMPLNGYLPASGILTGTVSDANLDHYTVELSDGPPAAAFRFVPIGGGTSSVESKPLAVLAAAPADGTYTARLTAVDKAGNQWVSLVGLKVKNTPPLPPVLTAMKSAPRDVSLIWTASPSADVVGYRVFRASGTEAFSERSSGLVTTTSFSDAGLADGDYRYEVVAVNDAAVGSLPSNIAEARIYDPQPEAVISAPVAGAEVGGAVPIQGVAFAPQGLREYRLSVGAGATPQSFALVARSSMEVLNGTLGTVDFSSVTDGSVATVLLEVVDLSGNTAKATQSVVVHNKPPRTLVLLSVVAHGADVALTWQSSSDSDLAGYLVYRNGAPVNAPVGTSFSSLSAYLLPASSTTYTDPAVPDGTFSYQVQAIDKAWIGSALSNSISIKLDNHPPEAVIMQPTTLTSFSGVVDVIADTPDLDVAAVQFEVRSGSSSGFVPLGAALTSRPYKVSLVPSAFASPVFELHAVATDFAGHVDSAPNPTLTALGIEKRAISQWDQQVRVRSAC